MLSDTDSRQQQQTTRSGVDSAAVSCSYRTNASGLWPLVFFYSLATVHVYQQSAPGLLQQLAAVTITSGMRKDSCAGGRPEICPKRFPIRAVQRASCSPCYCTCLEGGGKTRRMDLDHYVKAVFSYRLCLKVFHFVMVLIQLGFGQTFSRLKPTVSKGTNMDEVLLFGDRGVSPLTHDKQRRCFFPSAISPNLPSVKCEPFITLHKTASCVGAACSHLAGCILEKK